MGAPNSALGSKCQISFEILLYVFTCKYMFKCLSGEKYLKLEKPRVFVTGSDVAFG